MKKEYIKPNIKVMQLQGRHCILQASRVKSVSVTGLEKEEYIDVSDTGGGDDTWDR